jgi:hypothetical protein
MWHSRPPKLSTAVNDSSLEFADPTLILQVLVNVANVGLVALDRL